MPLPPFGENGLLPPGPHLASLQEIEDRCVKASEFRWSWTRRRIFRLFSRYIAELESINLHAIMWVDGSFLDRTRLNPTDIDVVTFTTDEVLNGINRAYAMKLLAGKKLAMGAWKTHVHLEAMFPPDSESAEYFRGRRDYWYRSWSTAQKYPWLYPWLAGKSEAPARGKKGFVQLQIGSAKLLPELGDSLT